MDNTELKLVISKVRDQARLTRSIDLRPAETSGAAARVEFDPGQIAILSVPGEEPAYFAFASAPGDPELEVLVKQKVGASKVLYDMQEGDEVTLLGICGNGSTWTNKNIATWCSSLWAPVWLRCVQRCVTS